MDISIIIPVYNGEETLRLCLDAVSGLTIPEDMNIEILLINDGSTDRTKEIASAYTNVKIIDLEKNMGRVVARKTGADRARFETLLFIDSRVIPDNDLLTMYSSVNYTPLLAGQYDGSSEFNETDRFFYLVRKRIYYPYFPQINFNSVLWINKNNFKKAPKGTTCLFIDRNLFLQSLPEEYSKETSDDTKLLKNIVFNKQIKILRHTDIKIRYIHRQSLTANSWIYSRGKLWSDYYLCHLNKYLLFFIAFHISVISLIVIYGFGLFLLSLMALYMIIIVALVEERRDISIVIKKLNQLGLRFYMGIIVRIMKKVLRIIYERPLT